MNGAVWVAVGPPLVSGAEKGFGKAAGQMPANNDDTYYAWAQISMAKNPRTLGWTCSGFAYRLPMSAAAQSREVGPRTFSVHD
jgi:hypothetical protein